jgi:anti-sigma-K factor RskA
VENIKAYIESGILELYVLGNLSPEERLQVEGMASKHAAVKAEIDQIEQSLEFYAEQYAVEPSEAVRDKILNGLLTNLGDDRTFTRPRKHSGKEVFENDIIPLHIRQKSFYKYAFAACLTLLLISIYGLINLYSKLQESSSQLTAMQLDKQKIANQVNLMDKELDMYRDTSYRILRLKGVAKTPQSAMTLAWSPATKKVVVDMHSMKLPAHDKQHQYQLWALVGGKPVDMGVFDANADTRNVKEMKLIAAADAFAVTLEPMGGSVSPTLDQMVVMGAAK